MAELDENAEHARVEAKPADPIPEYQALLRRIDEQPSRRRAVAIMYFLEDLNCEEIAEAMGISSSTVRTHLQRARADLLPYADKLRDAIEDSGQS